MGRLLGQQTYTVSRYAAGSNVAGDYVPGAESQLTVQGSLQPRTPDARKTQHHPSGARAQATWEFYTRDTLQIADTTGTGAAADELHHEGRRLVVLAVDDYAMQRPGNRLAHRVYYLAEKEHG